MIDYDAQSCENPKTGWDGLWGLIQPLTRLLCSSIQRAWNQSFIIVMTGDMRQRCKSNVDATLWNPNCGFESLIWFSLELLQWFYRRVPRWVNKGFTDAFTSNKEPGAIAKKVLPHQTIVRLLSYYCPVFYRLLTVVSASPQPFPQMLLFEISMNELSLRM